MLKRLAFIALLVVTSSTVLAQYDNQRKERSPSGSRDGRFEASVILNFQNGAEKYFEGGSALDMDSTSGWGVNLGWNLTQNLNLSYRLLASKADYTATIVPDDGLSNRQAFEHKASKNSHQLNVTYNFSEKAFSPFIMGGIGWTKLDSNITTGPPQTGCWWDPWWGYICFSDWSAYNTNELSYSLGLGFRWDINNAIFSKAAYSKEFLSLDNGTLNFDLFTLEIGLMF